MIRKALTCLALVALGACSNGCSRKDPLSPPVGGIAAPPKPGNAPGEFTIVVSGSLVGHLEPCGCSPDQRGGVARAAQAVEEIRKEGRPVLLLDAGDRFFPSAKPPTDPLLLAQHERQARAMAEITRLMRYDAVALTARDQPYAELLAKEQLPPLLDPASATPAAKTAFVQEIAGVPVGVFAVGDGDALLQKRAQELKQRGARVVVALVYRTFSDTKKLAAAAKASGVDFLVAARAEVPETTESASATDEVPVFQVAARGEGILRLDVTANGPAGQAFAPIAGLAQHTEKLEVMQKRIEMMREDVKQFGPNDPVHEAKTQKLLELEERRARLAATPPPALPKDRNAFSFAFVPMTPKLGQEAPVRAVVDAFNAQTAKVNYEYALAHPKACPPAPEGKASYVGDQVCVDCHDEAYAFWKTTTHAHAYHTLVEKNRQYDAACVSCHVTGYEQPGGACDLAHTEKRQDVQCESCHGPGSIHADTNEASDLQVQAVEATCRKCHDADNSPHFNFATYRPQIIGPGHGAPLAKK